jgi:hypothetical protein
MEQVDVAGGATAIGMHEKPFKPGFCRIVTAPLALEAAKDAPVESAAAALESWTGDDVLVVELEIVRATVATTPSEMAVEFIPQTMHFRTPAAVLHEIDLFVLVAAGPAATLADEKSVGE